MWRMRSGGPRRAAVMLALAALVALATGRGPAVGQTEAPSDGVPAGVGETPPASNGAQAGPLVIEVWKGERKMELREGETVVRRFQVQLGHEHRDGKRNRGDSRTPVGRYYISDRNPGSQFHRFLGVSYPNVEDAEWGYGAQLINADQWADIFVTNLRGGSPTSRTLLGGRIGIHGHGERVRSGDWTEGCIAVTNEEIEFLFARVPVGTPVIIND